MTEAASERDAGVVPPRAIRVVLLLVGLKLRRLLNRILSWRSRKTREKGRRATPRKGAFGKILLAVLGVIFLFQAVSVTTQLVHRFATTAEREAQPDVVVVGDHAFYWIEYGAALRDQPEALPESFRTKLRNALAFDPTIPDRAQREERAEALLEVYDTRGISGFRRSRFESVVLWPEAGLWYSEDPLKMLAPLCWIASLLSLAVALQQLAGADRELSKVDSGLEWLFSFPVPARSLFFARALESAFANPLNFFVVWPFYGVVFWCAGFGAFGLLLGMVAALYVGTLSGALRVALETTLRRYLSSAAIARVQAGLLVLSYVALFPVFVLVVPRAGALITHLSVPGWALFNPLSLPLAAALSRQSAWFVPLAAFVVAGLGLAFATRISEWMVRDGVTGAGGLHVGARGRTAEPARGPFGFVRGMPRKELLALLRDRRTQVQVFVIPVLFIGLQLWINPGLLEGILSDPRHAATAAYGCGVYVLVIGAPQVLASEGPALWMLYLFPERIERILLHKLVVAALPGFILACLVLLGVFAVHPSLILPTLPYAALALLGILLYSGIAFGIGILGTDPLEIEPRRRIRVASMYLLMILASLYGYALYVPSHWAKFVELTLSALLALALWQKVKDHAPFFLDPNEAPRPRIAVSDGIMAALAFFTLQGVIALWYSGPETPRGQVLLVAFTTAGLLVSVFSLLAFRLAGVPRVLQAVGLLAERGAPRSSYPVAALAGLLVGSLAAAFALGYGLVLDRFELFVDLRERSLRLFPDETDGESRYFLFALAVLAAPLFEEFVFRGVLYRGMRRALSATHAALGSALVFALVHPPLAALPVFVMALLATLTFERTRLLITPIAAHFAYNGFVASAAMFG